MSRRILYQTKTSFGPSAPSPNTPSLGLSWLSDSSIKPQFAPTPRTMDSWLPFAIAPVSQFNWFSNDVNVIATRQTYVAPRDIWSPPILPLPTASIGLSWLSDSSLRPQSLVNSPAWTASIVGFLPITPPPPVSFVLKLTDDMGLLITKGQKSKIVTII